MGQVEIIVDGVLVAIEFLIQDMIVWRFLGQVLNEVGNLLMTLVLPGWGAAPVTVEGLLHLLHLFDGSLFSVLLHTGVDCGVDFQAILVEVHTIFFAPVLQLVLDGFAEVERLTIVIILNAIVQTDRFDFQRVISLL